MKKLICILSIASLSGCASAIGLMGNPTALSAASQVAEPLTANNSSASNGVDVNQGVPPSDPAVDRCSYPELKKSSTDGSGRSLLMMSITMDCPDLMPSILTNAKEDEIFEATREYVEKSSTYLLENVSVFKGKTVNDAGADPALVRAQQNYKSIATSTSAFGEFLKSKCPDVKAVNGDQVKACDARKVAIDTFAPYKKKMDKFLADEKLLDEARQKESKKHNPLYVFKMEYCQEPNLFSTLFVAQTPVESKCIYLLHGRIGGLTVVHSVNGGILVTQPSGRFATKMIFIKTSKPYADGDLIEEQFVRSAGIKKYNSLLTVNAFEYLGDVEYANETAATNAWTVDLNDVSVKSKIRRSAAGSAQSTE